MKLLPGLNRFNKHLKRHTASKPSGKHAKVQDDFLAGARNIGLLRHVSQIVNISHRRPTDK